MIDSFVKPREGNLRCVVSVRRLVDIVLILLERKEIKHEEKRMRDNMKLEKEVSSDSPSCLVGTHSCTCCLASRHQELMSEP